MKVIHKRYQVGNLVQDWTGEDLIVEEVKRDGLSVRYNNGNVLFLEWHDLSPCPITKNSMMSIGFDVVGERVNTFHTELSMTSLIRGKFYNAKGYLYEDRSLWTFHGVSVLYIHQIQNIMSIIDPEL